MGVIDLFGDDGQPAVRLNGVTTGQYGLTGDQLQQAVADPVMTVLEAAAVSGPPLRQPAIVPKAPGRICPGCQSVGFEVSALGPDRCTFCDGTEGGNPPTLEQILDASLAKRQAQRAGDAAGGSAVAPLAPGGIGAGGPVAGVLPVGGEVTVDPPAVPPAVQPAVGDPSVELQRDIVAEIEAELPFCYLQGAAGTGKTTVARTLITRRDDAILCATTGIAAVNLGDATTINSLLGYFNTQSLLEHYASGYLQHRLRTIRRSGIRLIVLDEVSMFDADQLTCLCQAFDELDRTKEYDQELQEVKEVYKDDDFRMKLLLVGDFAQLEPVEAPFAFESPEWSRFHPHTVKLSKIRRQGDEHFVSALQAVRRGRPADALQVLEPCLVPTLDFKFPGTTIVAQNAEVDRINGMRHQQLAGPEWSWKTVRSGEQQKDWIKYIPESVDLKKGALVMILANRHKPKLDEEDLRGGLIYANGDLATVVEKTDHGYRVFLHRTFEEVTVTPHLKEWKEPTGKKNPRWTIKGTVAYMPLRLAYATTVHKSQGLTMDQVQVSIANWMFTKPGMLYVALSRARSLDGLRIVGNKQMFAGRCTTNPKLSRFL